MDEEIATAVRYRIGSEPFPDGDALPEIEGARRRYLQITGIDGMVNAAVVTEPVDSANGTLLLTVHGSGQHYAEEPMRALSDALALAGYAVLATNTRQRRDGANLDNYHGAVRDIEAAYAVARALGYDRVVLHGHSLGTAQVTQFASTRWEPGIVGLVLSGMFADLPWKTRHLLVRDEARYGELVAAAVAAAGEGRYAEPLEITMPTFTGQSVTVTPDHFLTYRHAGRSAARSVELIQRVPLPILLVRDANDGVILPFEANWMEAAARDGISPSVRAETLASPAGTNGHLFEATLDQLSAIVLEWLDAIPARAA